MADIKHCPVEGCDTPIRRDRNMCKPHWMSLPKAMRDAHWRVYNEFKEALAEFRKNQDGANRSRYRMAAQALRDSEAATASAAAEIEARAA